MIISIEATTIPVFFASGLAFLLALEQLIRKRPRTANILFSIVFLCCSVIIWGAGVVANGFPPKHPWTLFLFFTAITLVGPAYYFYFTVLLHPERQFHGTDLLHFIPAFATFCIEVGFQTLPTDFKREWLAEMFQHPPKHALMILVVIGAVHAFTYLSYLLRIDFGLVWNVRKVATELRFMLVIDVIAVLSVITLYAGFTWKIPLLFVIGGNSLALLMILVYLGYNRFPRFLQLLQDEVTRRRYERSSLTGVDVPQVCDCLMGLLQKEKVFTDPELNLTNLAEKLALTPHQLSECLNERMQSDFRSFINSFRVEEAKKLLAEDPDKSILEICFDVGFGSKSSFNAVFKKETGQTPSEFRRTLPG